GELADGARVTLSAMSPVVVRGDRVRVELSPADRLDLHVELSAYGHQLILQPVLVGFVGPLVLDKLRFDVLFCGDGVVGEGEHLLEIRRPSADILRSEHEWNEARGDAECVRPLLQRYEPLIQRRENPRVSNGHGVWNGSPG